MILEYIDRNIGKVLKDPVGFIHYPFIDPGSVYDGNVWDWDTYWSVYGLLPLADQLSLPDARERILRHARKWQSTPVFLPGESQGQGSLVGCSLWGRTESDTTEAT